MKYVAESVAGKKISAYIITKDGEFCAKIQAHHTYNSTVVNVFDGSFQCLRGTSLTTALAGHKVCGIQMYDDCASNETLKKHLSDYWEGKLTEEQLRSIAIKEGARLTNHETFLDGVPRHHFTGDREKAVVTTKWGSMYAISGLDRLRSFGYNIYQAI